MMRVFVAAALLVVATGCDPDIHDTAFQDFTVELWGPALSPGSANDPFERTQTFEVTLRFFEDAGGTVPYGASLTEEQLGETFADFSPVVTVSKPGSAKAFSLSEAGPVTLPGLYDANGDLEEVPSLYVSAEIIGRDDSQKPVARARCGVTELASLASAGAAPKVSCKAFYGLIGRWNPVPPPTQRRDFAAAVLPDGRVVIGGGRATGPLGTVEIFNPDAVTGPAWERVGDLSVPRWGLTATATKAGFVAFAGGKVSEGTFSSAVDFFNAFGDGGVTASETPLFGARAHHSMAPLNDSTVVVAGGYAASTNPVPASELLTAGFEPSRGATTHGERRDACLVQVETNLVLLCGGGVPACETYDGDQFRSTGADLFVSGEALGAVSCAAVDGSVFLLGGAGESRTIHRWRKGDKAPAAWSSDAPMAVENHQVAVANGKVVVAGGSLVADDQHQPLKRGFWFDPASDASPAVMIEGDGTAMLAARSGHQLVGLPDGTVMAIGGTAHESDVQAEVFVVP